MLGEDSFVSISVFIGLAVLVAGIWLAHYTGFGRTVYAIGGNERSAQLMGLPVARTKILVYGLSGFCSALSGVVLTFYMLSGYGLHAQGMELDAIAATVIGGTLLTGGAGYIAGTVVGVLILGLIQSLITFDGTLSSWWTRIAVGVLLCVFCLLQRLLENRIARRHAARRAAQPATPAKTSARTAGQATPA
jgi:simple sugar transport system permease protein